MPYFFTLKAAGLQPLIIGTALPLHTVMTNYSISEMLNLSKY